MGVAPATASWKSSTRYPPFSNGNPSVIESPRGMTMHGDPLVGQGE
jgi:hypothetical protein